MKLDIQPLIDFNAVDDSPPTVRQTTAIFGIYDKLEVGDNPRPPVT